LSWLKGAFPYIVLFASYIALNLFSNRLKNRLFFYLSIALVVFFVGFKDTLSPDLQRYAAHYYEVESSGFFDFSHYGYEFTYVILSKILRYFGLSHVALFFLYSLLTITFIVLGIKNLTNNHFLAFLFFLLIPGYFFNMFVEIRQMASVALVFYATSLISNNKKSFWFFAILSILFHYSAAVYWIVFMFVRYYFQELLDYRWYLVSLIVSFIVVSVFRLDLWVFKLFYPFAKLFPFLQKYGFYVDCLMEGRIEQVHLQSVKNIFYIVNFMVLIFLYNFSLKQKNTSLAPPSSKLALFFNLFFCGVLILNLAFYISPISRVAYFFLIFQIVIIPEILGGLKESRFKAIAFRTYAALYTAMFLKGLFYFSEEAQSYIFLNYKNIFLDKLFE